VWTVEVPYAGREPYRMYFKNHDDPYNEARAHFEAFEQSRNAPVKIITLKQDGTVKGTYRFEHGIPEWHPEEG
jgi:hypothetical protein